MKIHGKTCFIFEFKTVFSRTAHEEVELTLPPPFPPLELELFRLALFLELRRLGFLAVRFGELEDVSEDSSPVESKDFKRILNDFISFSSHFHSLSSFRSSCHLICSFQPFKGFGWRLRLRSSSLDEAFGFSAFGGGLEWPICLA